MDLFDDPRLTAMGLLAEVFAGLRSRNSQAFTAMGLSEVDFETLIRLARSPERKLRMSDLAGQTSLSTSGITRVVDRLEREGLVERSACSQDRRASYAVLTEVGADRLIRVLPQHLNNIEASFTGLLSPEQLADFLATLRVIRDVVRPCATAGVDPVSTSSAVPE
ncbi:MarR family transcriptional regulator [Planotetraspora sp. A-T 1434]|uniref:MarR family winged helix-turn-helix transcriptional regulator n=1 Tax=Planotetraspora sp. A-T 1434 TaxID=2979219 RepID=UPI0021C11771|nr:MarR family transcriptional regulator [Planotetraspora sp. A-T 1434]MCT9931691.1 MarR family transcriptional regulator [Planotetraspora sp. A-T 1434]